MKLNSFPYDFEPNKIPLDSKSKENQDYIPFNLGGNGNLVS